MLTIQDCCPTSLGISDLLIKTCILCKILLVRVIVVSSFSQVCLLECGITLKFLVLSTFVLGGGSVTIGQVT